MAAQNGIFSSKLCIDSKQQIKGMLSNKTTVSTGNKSSYYAPDSLNALLERKRPSRHDETNVKREFVEDDAQCALVTSKSCLRRYVHFFRDYPHEKKNICRIYSLLSEW